MKAIELTNDEYKNLLVLMSVGMWVTTANGFDSENKAAEPNTVQEALNQKILAKAADFGAENLVEHDKEEAMYFTSEEIDEEVIETMLDYDESSFWQELIGRLSFRDAAAELGVEEVFDFEAELSEEEIEKRASVLIKHEEKWAKLFEEKSLDTLVAA